MAPIFTEFPSYPREFVFGNDLNTLPKPLLQPTTSSSCVLIVGGGVTGLTTAWILLDKGYKVIVVSKEWASYGKEQRLTSQIAGALWGKSTAILLFD